MATLNPSGAGARMLAAFENTKGECLVAVGAAELNGLPVLDHALTALIAWNDAGTAHHKSGRAPADYPIFLGGAGGAGDVVIATGDGATCYASDYKTGGVIHWRRTGMMLIVDRIAQVGGPVLGWSDRLLGYDLVGGTSPAGGGGTPVTPPRRRNHMTMLYYELGTAPLLYALAGDSPGTPANWHETTDQGLANGWSAMLGAPSIALNAATFAAYKADYLAPVSTSGGGGGSTSGLATKDDLAAAVKPLATAVQIAALPAPQSAADALTLAHQTANTIIQTIPTAAQNGQAARAAIVAPAVN